MTTIIRIGLHLVFILMAVVALAFIVSLVSVFAVALLAALSAYFFVVRKYSLINQTHK